MGFLSPWALAGLVALGLPLWLHLLRQFKRTPQPFSSLMFFERRVQSSVRHRRLRYLALLALRLAMLALLALAFASPYIFRKSAQAGRRTLSLIAIDRSFSMREGNRLERAKEEAHRLVRDLPSGAMGQVAVLDSHLETLTGYELDRGVLAAAIDTVTAGDDVSSYGEFTRGLKLLEKSAGMHVEAHLISDMQQTSMPAHGFTDLQLGPDSTLQLHSVAASALANWAVENVTVAPQIFDPKKSHLTATIAGWQSPAAERRVSLIINGAVAASKSVKIPANGRAQVEFLGFDLPYGLNHGELRIEPHDTLPQDDAYLFSVERSDPRRVLFLSGGGAHEAFYYKTAMESSSSSGLLVDEASAQQAAHIDLAKFAAVVLNDPGELSTDAATAIRDYVNKGGGLLLAAGPNTVRTGKEQIAGSDVSAGSNAQSVGELDSQHPVIAEAYRFSNVQFARPANIKTKGAVKVIAKFADGTPLLIESPLGEGRVLLFACSLDTAASDFPLHSSYVPFVVQAGQYLAGMSDTPSSTLVGAAAPLRATHNETTAANVVGPGGKRELPLADASKAMSFTLSRAGFWEVQRANGHRALWAANADRRESDLAPIPDETLTLWRNTGSMAQGAKTTAAAAQAEEPWNLWKYFLALVLIAALVESVFATRYLKEERQTA